MKQPAALAGRLLLVAAFAAGAVALSAAGLRAAGYAPVAEAKPLDTLRVRLVVRPTRARRSAGSIGAVVPGYLSARGLPPTQGRFTITDTGLVFRSVDGSAARFPLVGPVKGTPAVSLAYIDESNGRPAYVFRVDAGVFETEVPGPFLDIASRPSWLDSVAAPEWDVDQRLVSSGDTATLWAMARGVAAGAYADSLYSLFGHPRAAIGLIGKLGRAAGRLGEYIGKRDSLALDPARMTGMAQLRHTLAHELGHRWQSHARGQIVALWSGVKPIRDPNRYGYGNASEHQAEAVAFAVNFLQTTASRSEPAAISVRLLDHYELLVPGTRTMARYLALQPIYHGHPLRGLLTRGPTD